MANKLAHLFKVEFIDGTLFEQHTEDKSVKDELRSSYYDLLEQKDAHGGIRKFWLEGEGHTYLVDLTDGHFEIDGVSFSIGEAIPPCQRELIYFRRHQHDAIAGKNLFRTTAHRMWQYIGWQANIKGKNYQQIINIKGI